MSISHTNVGTSSCRASIGDEEDNDIEIGLDDHEGGENDNVVDHRRDVRQYRQSEW